MEKRMASVRYYLYMQPKLARHPSLDLEVSMLVATQAGLYRKDNEQQLLTASDKIEVIHTPLLASAAEAEERSSRLGCSW